MTISGRAAVAGVMGWPVSHTLSPRLHGYWLGRYGIDGAYVPLAVPPEDLASALRALPRLGLAGVNLTVPHKVAALDILDEIDATARRAGAVNTVTIGPDRRLVGSNTDGYGFLESLRVARPGWHAAAGPATVIGAGGAARAICAALLDDGAPSLRVINRTPARAEALAAHVGGPVAVHPWDEMPAAMAGSALLVNATSLGMAGKAPLELDLSSLPAAATVVDIVYTPLRTGLLAAAAGRGNPSVDGLGMLLHQGRPGFAAWFGRDPAVDEELRAFVLAGLGA